MNPKPKDVCDEVLQEIKSIVDRVENDRTLTPQARAVLVHVLRDLPYPRYATEEEIEELVVSLNPELSAA